MLGRKDTSLPNGLLESIQAGSLRYHYKGIPTYKNPFDLALYAMLLWQIRPRTIIEIGTASGGSATWLADHVELFKIDGTIHTLDFVAVDVPAHPRLILHHGDVRKIQQIFPVQWIDDIARPLLVIDDGDHSYANVLLVLEHFGPLMRSGEYILVEDGIVSDLGFGPRLAGGPLRAIHEYLSRGAPFEIDRTYCDYFGDNVTWNPDGYLRRI